MPSFRATRYVCPLPAAMPLAPSLGFYLDNPREPDEIDAVSGFLRETLALPRTELAESAAWWTEVIDTFLQHGGPAPVANEGSDPFARLARMLVVARFDDEGTYAELRRACETFDISDGPGFILLGDDHPLVANDKALAAFCALTSLLVHTEGPDYFGETFVYDDLWLDHPREASKAIVMADISVQLHCTHQPELADTAREDAWRYYPLVIGPLLSVGKRLEAAYARGDAELLRFAGDILVSARNTTDARLRLLALVSILELLVTRNPDAHRFNVEESISRQFVLKVGVIMALESASSVDFRQLRADLRGMYGRRSAIAHGALARRASRGAGEESPGDEALVSQAYGLVRAVLNRFVDDPEFVRFLKEG